MQIEQAGCMRMANRKLMLQYSCSYLLPTKIYKINRFSIKVFRLIFSIRAF